MRIGIAGLGLIGGSLALALRSRHAVRGFDTDRAARDAARLGGIETVETLDELLPADAVIIATPLAAVLGTLAALGPNAGGTVMVDVSSVRAPVDAHAREHGGRIVGMHPMAGTGDGVMNHTVSGRDWQNLWFNDTLVGETGINAALCGTWGCPVLLVTGDEAACREAKALLGDGLTTVAVKEGLSALSARMLAPARARELVEAGAKQAVSKLQAVEPYDPGKPSEIRVEFKSTIPASKLRFRAGVELVDPRTIVSRGDDWWTAWRQFFF